jgi:sugar phosphate permease
MGPAHEKTEASQTRHHYAIRGLALLTFVNLFNYIDRYVVSAIVGSLKEDSALALDDQQAGLLMTSFIVVYTLASPLFGRLGDTANRPRLIALGVFIWSVATAAGGLAGSFLGLMIARALVGVGEAAYGTVAAPMIADWFPPAKRGMAYAVYFMAIPVGAALGYVLGGLADAAFGWRNAFFIAGLPGVLLAWWVSRIPDPVRGGLDKDISVTTDARSSLKVYKELLSGLAEFRLAALGYAAYTFAVGGLAFWMPSYLERAHGVTREAATVQFGGIVLITGLLGTLVGGWVTDKLRRSRPQAAMEVCAASTLLAVPFVAGVLFTESRSAGVLCLVVAQLLLFASTGPINTALVEFVPPSLRARASALAILIMHVLGDVPSPPLIGWLSDRSDLATALQIVPVAVLASGVLWLKAAQPARAESAAND